MPIDLAASLTATPLSDTRSRASSTSSRRAMTASFAAASAPSRLSDSSPFSTRMLTAALSDRLRLSLNSRTDAERLSGRFTLNLIGSPYRFDCFISRNITTVLPMHQMVQNAPQVSLGKEPLMHQMVHICTMPCTRWCKMHRRSDGVS